MNQKCAGVIGSGREELTRTLAGLLPPLLGRIEVFGKRVFRMAPIHHHYEQKGWTEPQIVIRFWIISIMLALIGLSTLKLR